MIVVTLTGGVRVAAAPIAALRHVAAAPVDAEAAHALAPWRAREFLAARALLRRLLAPEAGPIAAQPSGQPYLPERPELTVSLSHTHEHVAAAVGEGVAVGIDVQAPLQVADAVLRRCCRPESLPALRALPPAAREYEFAWIWTVQEACVKATGEGLAGRPWTIPVRCGQRHGTWRGHAWQSLRGASAVPLSVAYESTTPEETP